MTSFSVYNVLEGPVTKTVYYLGGDAFTGNITNGSPDWTSIVDNYTGLGTYTSSWIVGGTGGSGKILSVVFRKGSGGANWVDVTLQADGGVFRLGGQNIPNTYSPPPSCFVTGTRILTQNGYKAIETLLNKDLVVTADNRVVDFRLKKIQVPVTNKATAPYRIEAGAFGKNKPSAPLCVSPTHKIMLRKGVWISSERAARTNPNVKQYGVGEPITYWHIACDDYLKDNIIAENMVVETLATNKNYAGPGKVYTWNDRLGGFTRISSHPNVIKS